MKEKDALDALIAKAKKAKEDEKKAKEDEEALEEARKAAMKGGDRAEEGRAGGPGGGDTGRARARRARALRPAPRAGHGRVRRGWMEYGGGGRTAHASGPVQGGQRRCSSCLLEWSLVSVRSAHCRWRTRSGGPLCRSRACTVSSRSTRRSCRRRRRRRLWSSTSTSAASRGSHWAWNPSRARQI